RVVGERQPDGQHHREEGEGQQEDDRRQQVVPRHDPGEAPRDVAQDQDQRDGADGDADEGRRLGGEQAHQEVARDPHRGGEQQGQRDEAERPEDTAGGGAAAGQVVLQGTRDVDGGYPLGFGRAGGGRGRGAGLPRARGQGTVPLAAILRAVVRRALGAYCPWISWTACCSTALTSASASSVMTLRALPIGDHTAPISGMFGMGSALASAAPKPAMMGSSSTSASAESEAGMRPERRASDTWASLRDSHLEKLAASTLRSLNWFTRTPCTPMKPRNGVPSASGGTGWTLTSRPASWYWLIDQGPV